MNSVGQILKPLKEVHMKSKSIYLYSLLLIS